jgi:hypothetical protein
MTILQLDEDEEELALSKMFVLLKEIVVIAIMTEYVVHA